MCHTDLVKQIESKGLLICIVKNDYGNELYTRTMSTYKVFIEGKEVFSCMGNKSHDNLSIYLSGVLTALIINTNKHNNEKFH
jgi:hypothetical protein